MPLIILGLLVVGGLLAYMYFSGHSEKFTGKAQKESKDFHEDEEPAAVIYLPTDIEKEKRRRKVKTGK